MKGRADLIPLPDHAADLIFVERTPLSRAACHEIRRVVRRGGRVVLRHARPFGRDPHRVARVIFTGTFAERDYVIGAHVCQELVITMDSAEVIVSGDEPPGTGSSCQSSQAQHRDARPAAQPSALRQKN